MPERINWIQNNKTILDLPDNSIFIDYNHAGCVPTSKNAWSKDTDKPFIMVMSDDVELCNGFISYCKRIVNAHPDKIISLFPIQFTRPVPGSRLPKISPYILTNKISGCGIIMRTEWVKPCINSWPPDAKDDDSSIHVWAVKNRIEVLTTLPSLIQHIGDVSTIDTNRHLGKTPYFSKNPNNMDWDSKFITSWTNIIDE